MVLGKRRAEADTGTPTSRMTELPLLFVLQILFPVLGGSSCFLAEPFLTVELVPPLSEEWITPFTCAVDNPNQHLHWRLGYFDAEILQSSSAIAAAPPPRERRQLTQLTPLDLTSGHGGTPTSSVSMLVKPIKKPDRDVSRGRSQT